jgi:hypothetical protein
MGHPEHLLQRIYIQLTAPEFLDDPYPLRMGQNSK